MNHHHHMHHHHHPSRQRCCLVLPPPCGVLCTRRAQLVLLVLAVVVLLHLIYHIDVHFFDRASCYTIAYIKGSPRQRQNDYIYTKPTTNRTIERRYPSDPEISLPDQMSLHSHPGLPRMLNKVQKQRYIDLLRLVMFVFDEHNVTYCMMAGTLLGSYFFHDIIPWDDDIDLLVSLDDYPKLKHLYRSGAFGDFIDVRGFYDNVDEYAGQALYDVAPERTMYGRNYHKHKIFFKDEPEIPCYTWKWPWIDMIFYTGNETHIWDHDSSLANRKSYVLKSHYYPFHRRPLAGLWVPAPHNTLQYLRTKFQGGFQCSVTHCHKDANADCVQTEVSCSSLTSVYPYVMRTAGDTPATVTETLYIDKAGLRTAIHTVTLEEEFNGDASLPFVL